MSLSFLLRSPKLKTQFATHQFIFGCLLFLPSIYLLKKIKGESTRKIKLFPVAKYCKNMEKEKNMEEEKKEEDKGKGEITFRTAPEFRKLFIEQCLAQVNEFGFAGTSLKPSSWTNLCKFFSAKYDCTFTQKKLRNHWDYLRKQYVIWTSLLAQTGHGYNAETNLFDWSDERWEAIGKSIKNSTQFRYKGLEDADLLRGLFDGKFSAGADRDTPGRSETSVPLSVGTSTMPAISNNESGSRNSSLVKEKANVDDTEVDSNVGRSGKKRKKVAEEEASADLLTEKVCAMVNSMEDHLLQKKAKLEKSDAADFVEVLDNLLETDYITMDDYLDISLKASELIGWQKIFVSLKSNERRVALANKLLGKQ